MGIEEAAPPNDEDISETKDMPKSQEGKRIEFERTVASMREKLKSKAGAASLLKFKEDRESIGVQPALTFAWLNAPILQSLDVEPSTNIDLEYPPP